MTTDDAKENGQEPRVTELEFLTSLRALLEDHESRIQDLRSASEIQCALIEVLLARGGKVGLNRDGKNAGFPER